MKKSDFNYHLPSELIAQTPLADRSASRLLSIDIDANQFQDHQFVDFVDLINADDVLVFNNTRVIPARLYGVKPTGGKVEILIERRVEKDRALAHIKASKAPKPGTVILLDQDLSCTVTSREQDLFQLQFNGGKTVNDVLSQIGHIPLPPYINRSDDANDKSRYQTVFAECDGAVAAPTAGLHFDETLLERLSAKGVQFCYVTLHVGSGTFQPVRVDDIEQHVMHEEFYQVDSETVATIQRARAQGGRIIAIGTTSVRALEAASASGELKAGMGDTDIFITPGYQFRSVDALLTNFHLPESTLLMLVSAFAGYDLIMQSYRHAIEQQYRFFSYGDAMFLHRPQLDSPA